MRAVAKHSVELATCVTETGAVDVLVVLLEDFDVSVREAAAAALAGICSHGAGVLRSLLPFRAASTPCCDGRLMHGSRGRLRVVQSLGTRLWTLARSHCWLCAYKSRTWR